MHRDLAKLFAQHKLALDFIGKQLEAGQALNHGLVDLAFSSASRVVDIIDCDLADVTVTNMIREEGCDCCKNESADNTHEDANAAEALNAALDAMIAALKGSK